MKYAAYVLAFLLGVALGIAGYQGCGEVVEEDELALFGAPPLPHGRTPPEERYA